LDSTTILLALGLMLLAEGMLPFVAPARWRRMFQQLLALSDGQIRFFAAISISVGLLICWLVP